MKDQRVFFDELITEEWDTYVSEAWNYSRRFEVDRLFRKIQPATILDVGCGCGFHDQVMAEYDFVEKVDAIDYSEKSIRTAEMAYPHPKVRRIAATFEEFETEHKYDLVVSFQLLEHLCNPEEYLYFCAINCAPYVAISTPNRLCLRNRIRLIAGKRPSLEDVMHYREYSVAQIQEMGRQHGLDHFYWFGYGLSAVKGLSPRANTCIGYSFPHLADRIVVVFKKKTIR
jgi:2-polyprenyl-3-methyl-5-hydroxy-6-metoxy-1,4-benzoquinol methylase